MNTSLSRIKLVIKGKQLQAFMAISGEFKNCGKASHFGLITNQKEEKNFKFNDSDFLCVYKAIVNSLNGPRYPGKTGTEYKSLCELKEYFEIEYKKQRNHEIQDL